MCILRSQQRELSELRQNQMELLQRLTDHLDAIQSSLMGHMERVIDSQQEQERILACKGWVEGCKADQGMRRAQKGQRSWELRAVGAVQLHVCCITISVPLRARNSEIEQRTDTFSVPLNLSYPLNRKCCSAGVDQRCTRYIIPPQAMASYKRVIMG